MPFVWIVLGFTGGMVFTIYSIKKTAKKEMSSQAYAELQEAMRRK